VDEQRDVLFRPASARRRGWRIHFGKPACCGRRQRNDAAAIEWNLNHGSEA